MNEWLLWAGGKEESVRVVSKGCLVEPHVQFQLDQEGLELAPVSTKGVEQDNLRGIDPYIGTVCWRRGRRRPPSWKVSVCLCWPWSVLGIVARVVRWSPGWRRSLL